MGKKEDEKVAVEKENLEELSKNNQRSKKAMIGNKNM